MSYNDLLTKYKSLAVGRLIGTAKYPTYGVFIYEEDVM